jgi:hypothetical protein
MTKEEFILFIKVLGFTETWRTNPDGYSLSTDVIGKPNQNYMTFADQLKITLDERGLAQLSLSQMSTHMMSGKSFGFFQLETFGNEGDFQLELFLSFILGSFNKKPNHIIQFMRDMRIKNILE